MKYFQLALLCFLCFAKGYGQTPTRSYGEVVVEIIKEKKPKKIYSKVVSVPPALREDSNWIRSVEKSLNKSMPYKNGAKAGKYIAAVKLLVERDGSVADIACSKDPGFGMCKYVVEIMKKSPRWRAEQGDSTGKVREFRTSSITRQNQ